MQEKINNNFSFISSFVAMFEKVLNGCLLGVCELYDTIHPEILSNIVVY